MKKVAIVLGVILVILGVAFVWLHNNLDSLVKNAIEKYGSQMTGTKVQVSSVEIKASEGTGIVRGLVVGNPSGFKTPYALKVGRIEMVLDIESLAKPVVLIKKIAVSAPDVIYERANGTTNFDAIQKHVAEQAGSSSGPSSEKGGGKKLIVEHLSVTNAKAQASAAFMNGRMVSVSLPNIFLNNIGKAQGGVPPGELGRQIGNALKEKLEASINFGDIAKSMGTTLEKAGNALKGLKGFFGQ